MKNSVILCWHTRVYSLQTWSIYYFRDRQDIYIMLAWLYFRFAIFSYFYWLTAPFNLFTTRIFRIRSWFLWSWLWLLYQEYYLDCSEWHRLLSFSNAGVYASGTDFLLSVFFARIFVNFSIYICICWNIQADFILLRDSSPAALIFRNTTRPPLT